jgi:hypothetical protein
VAGRGSPGGAATGTVAASVDAFVMADGTSERVTGDFRRAAVSQGSPELKNEMQLTYAAVHLQVQHVQALKSYVSEAGANQDT